MSTNLHVMGNRIRTARQFRKLTAEQLSEQLGIATESLRHIENGTRRPSYALLDNISDILDVSLDYLAGDGQQAAVQFTHGDHLDQDHGGDEHASTSRQNTTAKRRQDMS